MTDPQTTPPRSPAHVDFGPGGSTSSDPAIVNIAESLRAALAGGEAAKLIASSAALFEAGGKHMLSAGAQKAVREVAERGAARAIAMTTGPILESAGSLAAKPLLAMTTKAAAALGVKQGAGVAAGSALAKGVGKQAMRMAGKQVLKGAGKAAGIGFVLDGAVAGVEAIIAVRNGSTDKRSAAIHVAKEATTGAIATGAGVLLGAGLVALTGGIGAPVVFAVGALGSIGAKRLLRRVVR
jgi:hypothetical protein